MCGFIKTLQIIIVDVRRGGLEKTFTSIPSPPTLPLPPAPHPTPALPFFKSSPTHGLVLETGPPTPHTGSGALGDAVHLENLVKVPYFSKRPRQSAKWGVA